MSTSSPGPNSPGSPSRTRRRRSTCTTTRKHYGRPPVSSGSRRSWLRRTPPPEDVSVHRLTRAQARRIAIRAQLLDARRPTDLLEVVSHLTFLQLDPTPAIAPSADLVAWTRLGD